MVTIACHSVAWISCITSTCEGSYWVGTLGIIVTVVGICSTFINIYNENIGIYIFLLNTFNQINNSWFIRFTEFGLYISIHCVETRIHHVQLIDYECYSKYQKSAKEWSSHLSLISLRLVFWNGNEDWHGVGIRQGKFTRATYATNTYHHNLLRHHRSLHYKYKWTIRGYSYIQHTRHSCLFPLHTHQYLKIITFELNFIL